jgi:hypothetical protein
VSKYVYRYSDNQDDTFAAANLLYLNVVIFKTGLCEYCRSVDVYKPSYNELILVSHRKAHTVLWFSPPKFVATIS